MLAEIGVPFIVFGIILLLIVLIAGKMMMKEPENPNCSEDVDGVKTNKKLYKILLAASIVIIVVGLVLVTV